MSSTNPDFYEGLMSEALITMERMADSAAATAVALQAQAMMAGRLLEASRNYRQQAEKRVSMSKDAAEALVQRIEAALGRSVRDDAGADAGAVIDWEAGTVKMKSGLTSWGTPRRFPAGSIFAQPDTVTPDDPRSTVHRTREGREVHPLSPMDEPGTFSDVKPEDLEAEALAEIPKVEIVEVPIPEVDPNTILDGSGRLVPDERPPLVPDFEAIKRMQDEDDARAEAARAEETPIESPADGRPEFLETRAARQEALPLSPDVPMPIKEPQPRGNKTSSDRILDHYAETGEHHEVIAVAFNLSPSTIASYISVGRTSGDPRAPAGDLKRLEAETAEENGLRSVFTKEAREKRDIVFFDDDMIGSPAYVVNYGEKQIETPEGNLPLSAAWLRIMDLLKDRDQHLNATVWAAGRFPHERAMLKNLRTINEALSAVKLYVVADATHYQLCGLL